jgi:eukaryotic-like serine/threonine-protein kinase
MGEDNPTPRSDPENPKKSVETGSAHIGAAGATARGETTFDTGGTGAAAARAEHRMSIGPYVLVRILGEGGMGRVWHAEQTAPVRRQVALKLIKGGLYDSSVIERFESERQSLAVMNHPAIAKVFDAGSTKDGQPYFVMEYVDGPPITRYCDNKKLKIRERLELFIKVCEGVQHAHQKAIIHRDLKPSNVLVTEVDGKPVPRIIDFGIAKAISSQPGAEQTQFTEMGVLIGTRGFMSPEQADPNVLDVDTRTDVYSLGALLYVLLVGMLPFDSEGGKRKPIDELLRQLREEDPPSPSMKVSTEKETATVAAERRGTETKQLAKLLRGDLDWITMKAVEKDRARRYGTPSELATDIERYLENRPVVARPASTSYRLKKYVQRHRVAVAAVSGAAVLLLAFAITQAVQLRRITRERDRANRITDFMTDMFKVSDPSEARGNTITAREILDRASKDINKGLEKDPELQARLITVMGTVYEALGLYSEAQSLHEQAVDIRRRILGPKQPDTLTSEAQVAWDLAREGHYVEAEKMSRSVLEMDRQALGPDNPLTLNTMYNLGWILHLEGRYAEAEKLDRETVERRRRVLGPEHPRTLASMSNVAVDLQNQGKYAEAITLQRETLEIQRRVLGPEGPDTLLTMTNLANSLSREGHYAEAEKLYRETLDTERHILGPEHPNTLRAMHSLAATLNNDRHYGDAEKLYLQTLQIERRVLGPEHPDVILSMSGLTSTLAHESKYRDAENVARQTLEIQRRVLGQEHPKTLEMSVDLAGILTDEGRFAEGTTVYEEALPILRRVLGSDNLLTLRATYNLACNDARSGKPHEALSLLEDAASHRMPLEVLLDMDKDPDLKSLRGETRFAALIADAKQRAAAAQKPN